MSVTAIRDRGAIVELVEWLDYGTKSRRKVLSVGGWASLCKDWKTLSVHPAVNGYLFRIREGQGSERRGMGFAFHLLCPRYNGTLMPTALRLMGYAKPLPFYFNL